MHYIIQNMRTVDDVHFLWRMSYLAVFPNRTPVPEILIQRLPACTPWVREFGRKGDAAVLAVADGRQRGAAWYRLFSESERVPGFLDASIPVLAIAVLAEYRRCGIGDSLLTALKLSAQDAHFPALSLSVAIANTQALELYERHGFQKILDCDAWHRIMRIIL